MTDTSPHEAPRISSRIANAVPGLLFLAIFIALASANRPGFINYDDPVYVAENPLVLRGVSFAGIVGAFAQPQNAGWTPLATISHMLDVQVFGADSHAAQMHRAFNIMGHGINVLLILYLFRRLTGNVIRSLCLATVFGLHPLVVEPAMWISSRKDVLCLFFCVCTLLMYARFTKNSNPRTLAFTVALFAAALLSKPMAVTLPVLLILLDYWPLRRFDKHAAKRVVLEKMPFIVLAIAAGVITFVAEQAGGAVRDFAEFPLPDRIVNALVSYVVYLRQFVLPVGLAVYYPHPGDTHTWLHGAAAFLLLAAITVFAFWMRKNAPYLLVGWLWYLISLLPVIGLIQIGSFAHADRFAYIPIIGLCLIAAWGVPDCIGRVLKHGDRISGAVFAIVAAALFVLARQQAHVWTDSVTLWTHALAVTEDNPIARNNLGQALLTEGRTDEAIENLEAARSMAPEFADPLGNLAIAYSVAGQPDKAIAAAETGLALKPEDANLRVNLGNAYRTMGNVDGAIAQYESALNTQPNHLTARYNLAMVLDDLGRYNDAVEQLQAALALNPNDANTHKALGIDLLRLNDPLGAIRHLQIASQTLYKDVDVHFNLGAALVAVGRESEARRPFEQTLQLKPDHPQAPMIRAFLGEQ